MLQSLYTDIIPPHLIQPLSSINLSSFNFSKPLAHWYLLQSLWSSIHPNSSILFNLSSTKFTIEESWFSQHSIVSTNISASSNFSEVPTPFFSFQRDLLSLQRTTNLDTYSILGLSLINPLDTKVILTEGVSDYFTAKLLCPNSNVLAFTTLGGSTLSKSIVLSLFSSFIICQDNDSTGRSNALHLSNLLKSYNKLVSIFTSPTPNKDLSQSFLSLLRFSKLS